MVRTRVYFTCEKYEIGVGSDLAVPPGAEIVRKWRSELGSWRPPTVSAPIVALISRKKHTGALIFAIR
jgi:hypothetical protein